MRFGGHPLHIGRIRSGCGIAKGFRLAIASRLRLGRGKAANIHLRRMPRRIRAGPIADCFHGYEERQEVGCIAGKPGELGDKTLRRRRRSRRTESPRSGTVRFLQTSDCVALGVGAVGVELDQDEVRMRLGDLRPGEHVGLHPMAVGAGVAGEVDEHELVLRLWRWRAPREIVLSSTRDRLG